MEKPCEYGKFKTVKGGAGAIRCGEAEQRDCCKHGGLGCDIKAQVKEKIDQLFYNIANPVKIQESEKYCSGPRITEELVCM